MQTSIHLRSDPDKVKRRTEPPSGVPSELNGFAYCGPLVIRSSFWATQQTTFFSNYS